MMSLGPIAFLSPWLLAALAVLPVIWWLLRVTPPAPKRLAFPPTRILVGLERREEDRAHSPWWLTLLRLAAAAAIILALARPVINPQLRTIDEASLYALIIDDGWASAHDWQARMATANQLVEQLEQANRPLLLMTTADAGEQANAAPAAAGKVRERLAGLQPKAWAPERAALLPRLKKALEGQPSVRIYYIADSLDYGKDEAFLTALGELAGGVSHVTVVVDKQQKQGPLALAVSGKSDVLARVHSPGGIAASGRLLAEDAKGRTLAAQPFRLDAAAQTVEVKLDLPLELRNQIARVEIEGQHAAGGVFLLDGEANRRRIGLVSSESAEEAQPLLSSLYYLRKALAPYTELAGNNDRNTAEAVDNLMKQNVTTLVLAGVGRISGATASSLDDWIGRGGILVRFAGPRLEKGGDDLLPVELRDGERSLGGALSWSKPQQLSAFEEGSPFFGLAVPDDVTVSRQVLADPASLDDGALIWARLADGTPLVTARKQGRGLKVLFHVTANSDWSSLPHSGLFVDMLRRLTALSTGVVAHSSDIAGGTASEADGSAEDADRAGAPVLAPLHLLDGFGRLAAASARAEPLRLNDITRTTPSAAHPPGVYGTGDLTRALNIAGMDTKLAPLVLPGGLVQESISHAETRPLTPYLLALALLLFLADSLIVALMKGLLEAPRRPARGAAVLLLGALLAAHTLAMSPRAEAAGDGSSQNSRTDQFALDMTLETHLAFVRSGDPVIDRNTYLGLAALSRKLARRTAFEPADPVGVDVGKDELAFFPLLYWPVPDKIEQLDEKTIARVNAYMKQGGLILFDTRDEISGFAAVASGGPSPIAQLIGRLDVPPLEPVANDHVLGRSFYLLDGFPGRWASGQLWAEAPDRPGGEDDSPVARSADGVSSILITSNDLAGAWAEDDAGAPLYAAVPGGEAQREMAYRVGINIVMYALTGNYKADQVHLPALMRRLGQ